MFKIYSIILDEEDTLKINIYVYMKLKMCVFA